MSDLKDDLAALRIERRAPRRSRAWLGWILALALVLAGGAAAWTWATRERPIDVQVAPVTERAAGVQASVLNASGYVVARRRATVSSKITGKVVEVNVEEGMAVREGRCWPGSTMRRAGRRCRWPSRRPRRRGAP
jgi:multidrug efflux pump subunit AcrA (membrane-fusion protein)